MARAVLIIFINFFQHTTGQCRFTGCLWSPWVRRSLSHQVVGPISFWNGWPSSSSTYSWWSVVNELIMGMVQGSTCPQRKSQLSCVQYFSHLKVVPGSSLILHIRRKPTPTRRLSDDSKCCKALGLCSVWSYYLPPAPWTPHVPWNSYLCAPNPASDTKHNSYTLSFHNAPKSTQIHKVLEFFGKRVSFAIKWSQLAWQGQ